MREIFFTPTNFISGASYTAELLLNNTVVSTINSLVENTQYSFTVSSPNTYVLRVRSTVDGSCVFTQVVQALFPIVTTSVGNVDCELNVYNYTINVTNPSTAGINIQYGWSLANNCSGVSNWNNNNIISLPADDVVRYIFIRNSVCCNLVGSTSASPCSTCDLNVINISFSCNG